MQSPEASAHCGTQFKCSAKQEIILGRLAGVLDDEELQDVIFVVGKEIIKANQMLLGISSEFFKKLFFTRDRKSVV